ncbi:membrane protein insertion efficiency factor YidD [Fundidesulfovibrio terrae]|uniref:membrane protein insertion efficiency factor YidD n=1 Tax=Fundidesulfovibrio terrae TaxID=2922866 RepID=UPI001FAFFA94|nr:membrane protein insertion efficiency factor YidD [Fundidesulfovibrio terrae]
MQRLLLALIALYRYCISPLIPGHCRFTPSCSEYAREAVLRFGPFRGSLLAAWRLLRCHPLCKPGYDPVPTTLSWHAYIPRRRARLAAK